MSKNDCNQETSKGDFSPILNLSVGFYSDKAQRLASALPISMVGGSVKWQNELEGKDRWEELASVIRHLVLWLEVKTHPPHNLENRMPSVFISKRCLPSLWERHSLIGKLGRDFFKKLVENKVYSYTFSKLDDARE